MYQSDPNSEINIYFRTEPTCIQIMTGKRIVKVACGSYHTLAISSTGEVTTLMQHFTELSCWPLRFSVFKFVQTSKLNIKARKSKRDPV